MTPARRWLASGRARRGSSGVTLVELLVAAAISAAVLATAWAWLWNIAAVASRSDDEAQAQTAVAAAARAVARDVRLAVAVGPPPSGRDPSLALKLEHDRLDRAPEVVLIGWDPSRRVLWRNAAGTYLSDRVTAFSVSYVTADGRVVPGAEMGAADWSEVRLVSFRLAVGVGRRTAVREADAVVGAR